MKTRRGDTMIEVLFAIAIFSLIAVSSIGLMNSGLAAAESTLELTMSRNEINAQAEAIRYIHSMYVAELASGGTRYRDMWDAMIRQSTRGEISISSFNGIDVYGNKNGFFAINTRALTGTASQAIITNDHQFQAPITHARLNFASATVTTVNRVEGLWITVAPASATGTPDYYDFYIQSCWYASGNNAPSTLDTVVRLYNPGVTS